MCITFLLYSPCKSKWYLNLKIILNTLFCYKDIPTVDFLSWEEHLFMKWDNVTVPFCKRHSQPVYNIFVISTCLSDEGKWLATVILFRVFQEMKNRFPGERLNKYLSPFTVFNMNKWSLVHFCYRMCTFGIDEICTKLFLFTSSKL